MTLYELRKTIDHYMISNNRRGENGEAKVLITLANPSVGSRAYCEVSYVGMGFDWEDGQLRIEPVKELVLKGSAKDDIIEPYEKEYNGRKYGSCKMCGSKVTKEDKYCRSCGQRLRK